MKQENEKNKQSESVQDILAELNELLNRMPSILADIRVPDTPSMKIPPAEQAPAETEKTGEPPLKAQAPVEEKIVPPEEAGFPDVGMWSAGPASVPEIEPSALGGGMVCPPTGMAVEGGAGEGLPVPDKSADAGLPEPVSEPEPEPVSEPEPSALGGGMVCPPTGMAVEGGAGEGLEEVPVPDKSADAGLQIAETEIPAPAVPEPPAAPPVPKDEATLILEPASGAGAVPAVPPEGPQGGLEIEKYPEAVADEHKEQPQEEKTVVLGPGETGDSSFQEIAGKSVPDGFPLEQVKSLGFLYASGDEQLCADYIAVLDDICAKSRKRLIFIKRAFVRRLDPGINADSVGNILTETQAIGVVCIGNVPDDSVREIGKAVAGLDRLFKYVTQDEAPQRSSAVDLIAELMLG